jgi:hypothetical protein
MKDNKYRLFLFKPTAINYVVDWSSATYREQLLGELKVDNLSVSIKLQDLSTINFDLPENIFGEFNPRLNEVLDNYIVELWYGDLSNPTIQRFIITKLPLEYNNGIKKYCYEGNSLEHSLEFKQMFTWDGVQVKDFYRTIRYDYANNRFTESPSTGNSAPTYSISSSTYTPSENDQPVSYITVPTTTAATVPPSTFDIFIYQYRRNATDTLNSETSLIEYNQNVPSGTLYQNDSGFKPGFYIPVVNANGKVTSINIALPKDFRQFNTPSKVFEIFLYDNPVSRHFAVGINTDEEIQASDMYLDLAQDKPTRSLIRADVVENSNIIIVNNTVNYRRAIVANQTITGIGLVSGTKVNSIEFVNSKIKLTLSNNYTGNTVRYRGFYVESLNAAEYGNFGFTPQLVYSRNGLKLSHILNGNVENSTITYDGILYDSGYTIGTIHATIAAKYRSNIQLNNISKYEAIKTLAESFDAIAIFNSVNKTVSFYPDKNESVFTNNGLIITKENYLKDLNNDIDASKIVTKAYAAGKDNLPIALITPNGENAWEDYSYYLDRFYVKYPSEETTQLAKETAIAAAGVVIANDSLNNINNNTGVNFTSFPTGSLARYIDSTEALKIAKWQYARDYFHDIMLGQFNPVITEHDRYFDLYNLRSATLNNFVKEESKYFELKATEYRYKYSYDSYVKENDNLGENTRQKAFTYKFDSSTEVADPGTNDFRLNNASFSGVTKILIDDFDNNNFDRRAFLAGITLNKNPQIVLADKADVDNGNPINYVFYQIDSVEAPSGYIVLNVTYLNKTGAATVFTNTNPINLYFLTWEEIYKIKYDEAVLASAFALTQLNKLHYNLYNSRFDGSVVNSIDVSFNTTNLSATITTGNTSGLIVGQSITGTGIPANTKILSITNSTTLEMTNQATATNTQTLLQFSDSDYDDLIINIQPNSFATKISEVQGFLSKSRWSIDEEKLKPFIKEAVMSDSNLDNELDLLNTTREYLVENSKPIVTLSIGVVDFLASQQSSVDWNKVKIGEIVNIYFPDFNIDTTAQLREISIDFQENTLGFVISTYRQYTRVISTYIMRQIRKTYDNQINKLGFNYDNNNIGSDRANIVNTKLTQTGFSSEQAPVKLGAKSSDGSTSSEISGEGIVSKVIEVDPVLETFIYKNEKSLQIADGTLTAKNLVRNESDELVYTTEVEVSGDNGFVIRKIDTSGVATPQVYIDTNGNAVFAGSIQVGSEAYTQIQSLAGAGTTVFKAGSIEEFDDIDTANINDLLLITATFTQDNTPEPNVVYEKDDMYRYELVAEPDTFDWVVLDEDFKNKINGSVGGWTINATDIKANNNRMTLHSDSNDSGRNPYISIGQNTEGYNEEGTFIGIVGETGDNDGTPRLSLVNSTIISEITFEEAFISGSILNITNGAGTWTTDAAVYNAVGGVSPTNDFFNIEDGATVSSSTGPDLAYQGTKFLYYESSGTSSLTRDLIFTYTTTSTTLNYISFYYHMFGVSTTSLTLFRNGTTEILWRKTGSQGNQWYEATVPVIAGTTTLRFRVVGDGSNFTSDIALDHIRIYSKLNKLAYDPTLGLFLTGNVTATSGNIGGFEIGGDFLRAGGDNTSLLLKHDTTDPFLSIGQLTQGYNQNGIFLGKDNQASKFSLISESAFMVFDSSATNFKLRISGEAKIGPLILNEASTTFADLTFTNHARISATSGNILNATYTFGTQDIISINIESNLTQVVSNGIINRQFYFEVYKDTNLLYTSTTTSIPNFSGTTQTLNFSIVMPSDLEANKIITYVSGTAVSSGSWTIIPSIIVPSARINLGNFSVNPNGVVTGKNIINNGTLINVGSATFGSSSNDRILIRGNSFLTPFTSTIEPSNLSADRTLTLPNASGTVLVSTDNLTYPSSTALTDIFIVSRATSNSDIELVANDNIRLQSTDGIRFYGATIPSSGATNYARFLRPSQDTVNTIDIPVSQGTIGLFRRSDNGTGNINNRNIEFRIGRYTSPPEAVVGVDSRKVITFAPAFPTGLTYGVIVTPVGAAGMGLTGATIGSGTESISNINFTFVNDGNNNAAALGFSWIAFAY